MVLAEAAGLGLVGAWGLGLGAGAVGWAGWIGVLAGWWRGWGWGWLGWLGGGGGWLKQGLFGSWHSGFVVVIYSPTKADKPIPTS